MHEQSSSRRRRLSVGTSTAALSLGLCLCAGQLISTPAASAATPVVTAAQAKVKLTPTVKTSVSTHTLAYGKRVRVTARFFDPKSGKVITSGQIKLQGNRGGKWTTWAGGKISKSGYGTLYAAPHTAVTFRIVRMGTGTYNVKYSQSERVTVRNTGARILAEAKSHTGALYKFAAAGPKRFDCSGFTLYVYKKAAGKSLPHKANSQQHYGKAVSKGAKQAGDLIIFRSGSYGYHAGIYAGSGYMYDSPHTGARVGKHKMYGSNYVVRRVA